MFKKRDTFIQRHDQSITVSNRTAWVWKKNNLHKSPRWNALHFPQNTKTKISCYTVSHKYSPDVCQQAFV